MKTILKVVNPDKIEMELTITMPLSDWIDLDSQLSESWPSSELSHQITLMVIKAKKHFIPDSES